MMSVKSKRELPSAVVPRYGAAHALLQVAVDAKALALEQARPLDPLAHRRRGLAQCCVLRAVVDIP